MALNRLLDEHDRVRDALRSAEHAASFASEEQVASSERLAELERRRAGGESVADAEVKRAEKDLTAARSRAAEPWPERRRGLAAAVRDSSGAVAAYVARNFDALAEEVEADALAVAERMNVALEEVAAAHAERERVSAHATALLGQVEVPRPGAIAASRCEPAVRACQAALQAGGETPPAPRRREVAQAVTA